MCATSVCGSSHGKTVLNFFATVLSDAVLMASATALAYEAEVPLFMESAKPLAWGWLGWLFDD
jgi:hypothetical protein